MKRRVAAALLATLFAVSSMVGCGNGGKTNEADGTETPAVQDDGAIKPTYVTVTEGRDWGPAIPKIILDFGVELDASSVKAEAFTVSSVRTYGDLNEETWEIGEPTEHVEERNVVNAYLSDEAGQPTENGTHVTLEMEIAPYLEAGSPFWFNMLTYQNDYAETSYQVSLVNELMTSEGTPVAMATTTADGYVGNINVLADDFDTDGKYTYTYDDGNRQIDLTYASWFPEKSEAEGSTPLIIWLHGAGEGGTDPNVAILGNKVVNLITDDVQQYFGDTGAAVLAPQSPTMWMDTSGQAAGSASLLNNTGKSYYTEALMSLITEFIATHPEIDTTRVYLGGCSNGGFMTINMLLSYPGAFAAAFPVCEPYANEWLSEEDIATLAEVPMWLTASKTDSIVTLYEGYWDEEPPYLYHVTPNEAGEEVPVYEYSNALYDRVSKAGGEIYYSLFDSVVDTTGEYFNEDGSPYEYDGHWSWIYTLNNECVETVDGAEQTIFEWLSQQQGEGNMPKLPIEKEVFPPVYFYITRHGQTEYNVQELVQGWCDSPLTELGIEQAQALSNGLKDIDFAAVYTSDSKRAVDTCNLIMEGRDVDITVTEGLREINFGELEATDASTLWDDEYHAWVGYDDVGGETYEETGARVKRVLDLAAADLPEGGNVLISTHGLSIISLLDVICPDDPLYQTLEAGLDNCSITILEYDNGAYTLKALNDVSYLE
ncbi:MAG: histidine phosphatase family protein [Clostridiales bacterium]|nr:histidine phosphatase family protein [Roseburia sp.]MDD7636536.1 histidine phosphatase family protein [Clostridiales bacterium]MDY4114190.1 histidine phosphatase family protein [Roseburia sp.]